MSGRGDGHRFASTGVDADAVLDAVGAAVLVADVRGLILHSNQVAGALFGGEGGLAGRPLTDLIEPSLGPADAAGVLTLVASGGQWRGDVRLVGPEGRPLTV